LPGVRPQDDDAGVLRRRTPVYSGDDATSARQISLQYQLMLEHGHGGLVTGSFVQSSTSALSESPLAVGDGWTWR